MGERAYSVAKSTKQLKTEQRQEELDGQGVKRCPQYEHVQAQNIAEEYNGRL